MEMVCAVHRLCVYTHDFWVATQKWGIILKFSIFPEIGHITAQFCGVESTCIYCIYTSIGAVRSFPANEPYNTKGLAFLSATRVPTRMATRGWKVTSPPAKLVTLSWVPPQDRNACTSTVGIRRS